MNKTAITPHNLQSLRKLIEEKVESSLEPTLSLLFQENPSLDTEEIIKKIDTQSIEDEVLKKTKRIPETWMNINLEKYDYVVILDNLNSNSTLKKVTALDELLTIQIIDTKQKLWEKLSDSLQKCFLNINNEIFMRTLKLHYRMITFPDTCLDGYLNLLRSTFLLLNSRYFYDSNKNRILLAFKLILNTHEVVTKFLLHASHSLIDEIINSFVNVISFKTVLGDWIGNLDPQTKWLKNFCYGAYIRNTFFSKLTRNGFELIICNIDAFITNLHQNNFNETSINCFLLYFLSYSSNLTIFPLKLRQNKEITVDQILGLIITKVNQQKNFHLICLIVNLFEINPKLLNLELVDLLMEPLNNAGINNIENVIEKNLHIFIIISNLAKSSQVLRNSNLPQKLINLGAVLLESQISRICVNEKIIHPVLTCCKTVFESHSLMFIHTNPTEFLTNLQEFYNQFIKSFNEKLKTEILSIFLCFSKSGQTYKILEQNNPLLQDLFSFMPRDSLKSVIYFMANTPIGYHFLKNNSSQFIKSYLNETGCFNDDCGDFRFLVFFYVAKCNTKTVLAFLSEDNESEAIALEDLLKNCLSNSSNESHKEYLALLLMKVMFLNLDLLLYLETNYQVQEKLQQKQGNYEEIVIDCNSYLRHNILTSINLVGVGNENLNKLEQTELFEIPESFDLGISQSRDAVSIKEFQEFLKNSRESKDSDWFLQARRLFKNTLNICCPSVLIGLFDEISNIYTNRKIELVWPSEDSVYCQLHPEDLTGIATIINFGVKCDLLSPSKIHNENLSLLMKQTQIFLEHESKSFTNFDWFVGLIFLICSGDFEKSKSLLITFTNIPSISIIWVTFGRKLDPSLQQKFYQELMVVLEDNCPCFQALNFLGITPEILIQSWLNQCFFNLLNFREICNFLIFGVLYPPECLLYYIVAIFQHLNEPICNLTYSSDIENIIKVSDLWDFSLNNYLSSIEKLEKCYQNIRKL